MPLIIDAALVERCAMAAYVADRPATGGDWDREGDSHKELYHHRPRRAHRGATART